jgi:hypothetical protein
MRLQFKDDTGVLAHSPWFSPVICYMPFNELRGTTTRINWDQIWTTHNAPTIPKIPSRIAGQVPAGKAGGAPLPLNGT